MNVLAINTAGATAQIAVQTNKASNCLELNASMKHSENLLPAIEKLLTSVNLTLKDLDYLAVNIGPGSFTGLRIAVATAKGLLLTNKNIQAIMVNSFELMADAYFETSLEENAKTTIKAFTKNAIKK